MLSVVGTSQSAIERRRGEVERARSVQGQTFRVTYMVSVRGSGECTVDVNFPVKFSEKPGVSHGGELAPGAVLESSNFPTCSVMVKDWVLDPLENHKYYVGATLVLVVTGPSDQDAILHFHAEGKALIAPVP